MSCKLDNSIKEPVPCVEPNDPQFLRDKPQTKFKKFFSDIFSYISSVFSRIFQFFSSLVNRASKISTNDQVKANDSNKDSAEPRTISLNDIEKIVVGAACAESYSCQHNATLFLKDGRKAYPNSIDICSIVSSLALEKINPEGPWDAKNVIGHFHCYNDKTLKSPEETLNNLKYKV